jgi:hypothetical protein
MDKVKRSFDQMIKTRNDESRNGNGNGTKTKDLL